MTRKINEVLWETWRERIERQRQCGGAIVAFCRSEGVSEASFHYWQRKLRQATVVRNSPAPKKPMTATQGVRRSKRTSVNGRQLPVMAARPSPWIELTLADGTFVRVPQQNTAALVSVLRILRGQPLDPFDLESRHA